MIMKCWTKTASCEVIMGKTGLFEGRRILAPCPIASDNLMCILCILHYVQTMHCLGYLTLPTTVGTERITARFYPLCLHRSAVGGIFPNTVNRFELLVVKAAGHTGFGRGDTVQHYGSWTCVCVCVCRWVWLSVWICVSVDWVCVWVSVDWVSVCEWVCVSMRVLVCVCVREWVLVSVRVCESECVSVSVSEWLC